MLGLNVPIVGFMIIHSFTRRYCCHQTMPWSWHYLISNLNGGRQMTLCELCEFVWPCVA